MSDRARATQGGRRTGVRPAGERPGRRARVDAGVRELLIWLEDQLTTGLARLQSEAYRRFDAMGARLVDAQAPGLAGRVRALAGVTASGPGWNDRLLAEFAQLYSLARAHQRLDELPEPLAATVRTHVGYPVAKASVLAGPPVSDAWYVIGRRDEYDGVLATRRTWLVGGRTGRPALVLSFAARGQGLDDSLRVGTTVLADLHFYPGSLPLRALVGTWHGVLGLDEPGLPDGSGRPAAPRPAHSPPLANGPGRPPPAMTLAQVRRRWATCVERDPWVRRCAVVVAVAPVQARATNGSDPPNAATANAALPNAALPNAAAADAPVVWRDADGDVIPQTVTPGTGPWPAAMRPRPGVPGTSTAVDLRWVALAVGGGDPVPVCAEVDDRGLTPLAVWTPDGAVIAGPGEAGHGTGAATAPGARSAVAARTAWADLVGTATVGIDAATALPRSLASVKPALGLDADVGPAAALRIAALLHAARRGGLGPGNLADPLPTGAVTPYPNAPDTRDTANAPNAAAAPDAAADPPMDHAAPSSVPSSEPSSVPSSEPSSVPSSMPSSVRLAERILAAGPPLTAELAEQAARRGRSVPVSALAAWVAAASLDPDLAAAAVPLLGARGRWLAAANPAWQDLALGLQPEDAARTAVDPAATATPQRRARLFRGARLADPHAARDRLDQAWTRHPPPARAALLGQLRMSLSLDDEPFLERALTDRSAAVRAVAAELLSALPDSGFRGRLADAVGRVMRPGAAGTLSLAAPPGGVTALLAGLGAGQEGAWLPTLAALAPLDAWSRSSGRRPEDLVGATVDPPGSADILAAGWQAATLTQRDAVWAAVFLAGCAPSDHRRAAPLLAVLAATTQDPATTRTVSDRLSRLPAARASGLGRTPDAAPADELAAVPGPWTADVAAPALGHLEQRMRGAPPDPADHRAAQLIALRADPAWLRPRLGDLLALTPSLSRWRPVLLVAADLADLRHRLEQESP